jgi:hypothetical protein
MELCSELDTFSDPAHPSFTEEGVQRLLALKSSETEAARMEELAGKRAGV